MRSKIVPPVRDVEFLHDVSDALPRVPGSVEDCCSRIRDRTDLPSRDRAREYLTFCRSLGLAAETDGAYYRPRTTPEPEALERAFVANVFGARELLAVLPAEEGDAVATVVIFDRAIEDHVPRWERNRNADWRSTWRERTERLCGWAVVFGLAEREDDGYRRVGGE